MTKHNICRDPVFNIIKKNATEDNPISQAAILRILNEDPENSCERKTVSRALQSLIEKYGKDEEGSWIDDNIHLNYKVVPRGNSPIHTDFWLELFYEDDFTDEELMFLMDAVQFSKHVSKDNAEEITKKLVKLSHNRYSPIFELHTKINEKTTPVRKDFFLILGEINEAINSQKMISFYNNVFDTDKKLHKVGDEPIKVCPYKVVVSEGKNYLLCSEKDSNAIERYRIDRISDVTILDEKYPRFPSRVNAALNSSQYIVEHCYMYEGETVNVKLEIEKSILGEVIDSFGDRIMIEPAHPSYNRLLVHVKSSERDILDWAMRFGEYAVILEPDYLREEILARARFIKSAYNYNEADQDIEYQEAIKRADGFKVLMLDNIDLNRQDTYKDLTGVRFATFRHNGIRDFSFLSSYNELSSLKISHNEIGDPGVLSGVSSLRRLCMDMTGITNLDFLRGLKNLRDLSIHEYTLKNVEAIYSLPRLRTLTVNKPVSKLIDRRRFKRANDNPVEIIVCNSADSRFRLSNNRLPSETNRHTGHNAEAMEAFTTCEVTEASVKTSLASQIYAGRNVPGSDEKFSIVDSSCYGIERSNLYEDIRSFANEKYSWYVTYKGSAAERLSDVDEDRICSVSIFKRDHGLKLICMGIRDRMIFLQDHPDKQKEYASYYPGYLAHIKYLLDKRIGWAEVSGDLERYFMRASTIDNVINPELLKKHKVVSDIDIDYDGYHYYRSVNGEKRAVNMIAYGHIE